MGDGVKNPPSKLPALLGVVVGGVFDGNSIWGWCGTTELTAMEGEAKPSSAEGVTAKGTLADNEAKPGLESKLLLVGMLASGLVLGWASSGKSSGKWNLKSPARSFIFPFSSNFAIS